MRNLHEEFLMLANDTLDGIIYHLDPLEFYEEEVKLTPKEIEEITKELMEKVQTTQPIPGVV